MGSINQFLNELGAGTNIKDFQHASKIFVDDNYRLSPKYAFLFHVAFDINPELSRLPKQEILEMGMMVKSAGLPKFTVDTKTLNAYNRVNIVQNKLKYDPVTITFHDDSADVIRDFWYDYMSYYYRDTDYTPPTYAQAHKYTERQTQDWGYKPARYGATNTNSEKIIRAIRIYSLHQKRFTEYVLINPVITNFQHGEHANGQNELMSHTMTVSYETVLYNYGYVDPGATVNGFAELHYDKTPSPLTPQGGGTKSILGPGGLLNSVDSVVTQLGQEPPNVLGAGLMAYKAFKNFKGANLGAMAGVELAQMGKSILNGNNPLNKIYVPSMGGLPGAGGLMGIGGAIAGGAGLMGLFKGQQGGPGDPGGATANQTLAGFAGTGIIMAANGFDKVKQLNPFASKSVSSNGEGVGQAVIDPNKGPIMKVGSYDANGNPINANDLMTGEGQLTTANDEAAATDEANNANINETSAEDGATDQGSTGYEDVEF